jgi:hypothetical protein
VNPSSKYFDSGDLKHAETIYREQLRTTPEDMALRLSLAWCLFMQALHRSGQEAVLAYSTLAINGAAMVGTATGATERSANTLLKDCLQQTYAIKHLTLQDEQRLEVARLHALVELAGAQELSVGAEEQSVQRLVALAREAMRTADGRG